MEKIKKFSSASNALAFIDKLSHRKLSAMRKKKIALHSKISKEKRTKEGVLLSCKIEWSVSYRKRPS
jgi:hypothetical protein